MRRGDLKGPTLDLEGVAFCYGQSNLAAGTGNDALKRGTGDPHATGRILLGQAFQVGQPQGFQFLLQEHDAAQTIQRHTGRLVDRSLGRAIEETPFPGPGHATLRPASGAGGDGYGRLLLVALSAHREAG